MILPPFRPAVSTGRPTPPAPPLSREALDQAMAAGIAHGRRAAAFLAESPEPYAVSKKNPRAKDKEPSRREPTPTAELPPPKAATFLASRPPLAERLAERRAAARVAP